MKKLILTLVTCGIISVTGIFGGKLALAEEEKKDIWIGGNHAAKIK